MVNSEINQPPGWENIFAIFVLFLSTGAIIPLLHKENGVIFDPAQGDMIMQGLWFGIYTITFLLLLSRLGQVTWAAYQDKLICLLLALALVSVFWSASPYVTLRRNMALLGSSAFGIYLASRFTWQELIKLIAWALGLSAVLSLGFVLFLPSYGIHHDLYHSGVWRGIYVHKNALGRFMSFAALTWLLYSISNTRDRVLGLIFYTISTEILFLSASKTSIIIFILLLFPLMIYLFRTERRRYVLPVILIALIIGSSAFLLINKSAASAISLGPNLISVSLPEVDSTLTGRTVLWQAVWDMIEQRPLLGYGYSAFWLGYEEPSGHLWRILHWEPPNAHNGYLDLWLQLGLVGLVFFIISLIGNMFKTIVLLRRKMGRSQCFCLLFLLFIIIGNFAESFILVQNCIFWILYVTISTKVRIDWQRS